MALFPAFLDRPANIKFAEQEVDEHIELFLRSHGITNIPWIFLAILGYFVPILVADELPNLTSGLSVSVPNSFFQAAVLLWYMALVGFTITRFLNWYFDIYIVTNKHLIDISLDSLLSSSVTETQLSDVQSTRYQFKGLFGSIFRYGNDVIETAAKDQTIDFIDVPKPDRVCDRIEDLRGGQLPE